jgi:hypothetical protein
MKTFEDYMATPEVANEPLYLREIHAARLMMQDKTRGMSSAEWLDYWNQKETEPAEKYGLKNNFIRTAIT